MVGARASETTGGMTQLRQLVSSFPFIRYSAELWFCIMISYLFQGKFLKKILRVSNHQHPESENLVNQLFHILSFGQISIFSYSNPRKVMFIVV